jgi:hypothetical protein
MKKATTTIKKPKSGSKEGTRVHSSSQQINARTKELNDWRGEALAVLTRSLGVHGLSGIHGSDASGTMNGKCSFKFLMSFWSSVTSSHPSRSARATYRQS